MLKGVKSVGTVARLSSTKKLLSHRCKYPTSTYTRGRRACCARRPHTPALARGVIEVPAQCRGAEVQVRDASADVAPAGLEILQLIVQEIAIGNERPVRIGAHTR